mgnify:CR=1 FL=1
MAFVFDSTPKSETANSYVSVAEADDYFAAHLDGNFWPTDTKSKQAALVMATNRIDSEVFGGRRTDLDQSLQWPRSWIVARDFNPESQAVINSVYSAAFLNADVLPRQLKIAAYEQALHYLKMKAGEFTIDENDLETLSTYKVGPLDIGIKDNIKADRLPTKVKQQLKAIGPNAWDGDGALRLVR